MVLGYLVVRLVDRVCGTRTSTWLALTVGRVPDIDLAFAWFGIEHHTYTHSLLLWLPLLVFVYWRKEYFAAYVGILQHMLDDMLVGPVPILLPLSPLQVGFAFGVPSIVDTILKLSALLVAASGVFPVIRILRSREVSCGSRCLQQRLVSAVYGSLTQITLLLPSA